MKRDKFDHDMRIILETEDLKPSLSIENIDSMTRVEIIMMVEEHIGKELTDSQLKKFKTYQEILDLIDD